MVEGCLKECCHPRIRYRADAAQLGATKKRDEAKQAADTAAKAGEKKESQLSLAPTPARETLHEAPSTPTRGRRGSV